MIFAGLLAFVSTISTVLPNLSVVVLVVEVSSVFCSVMGVDCVNMVIITVSSPIVMEQSSTATATVFSCDQAAL